MDLSGRYGNLSGRHEYLTESHKVSHERSTLEQGGPSACSSMTE